MTRKAYLIAGVEWIDTPPYAEIRRVGVFSDSHPTFNELWPAVIHTTEGETYEEALQKMETALTLGFRFTPDQLTAFMGGVHVTEGGRARCKGLEERIHELEEAGQMACQDPKDDCDCPGCCYADEVNGVERRST